jgi:hypothetical protein
VLCFVFITSLLDILLSISMRLAGRWNVKAEVKTGQIGDLKPLNLTENP